MYQHLFYDITETIFLNNRSQLSEETTMPLLKNPDGFSEKKPTLQLLEDSNSELTLTVDDVSLLSAYVEDLPEGCGYHGNI